MKQTLYFEHLQNALCVQTNMKALDGIEADGPGEIDADGYYAVSWSTDQVLSATQKGRILRLYQPDGVDFNLTRERVQSDQPQAVDVQVVPDYRYTDDPTYGQFNL